MTTVYHVSRVQLKSIPPYHHHTQHKNGTYHEMPQKACEWGIDHVTAFSFSLKCSRIENIHSLSCFKIDHVIFLQNGQFFYVQKPWNAPFSHQCQKMGKIGHFKVFENKKNWGISGETHMTCFSNITGPKMKFNDFSGFFEEKSKDFVPKS